MKKFIKIKNNRLKIIAIFVLLLLVVMYACETETLVLFSNQTETQAIDLAKDWYNANKPLEPFLRASEETKKVLIKPEWSHAFSEKNAKYDVVETDLASWGMFSFTMPKCMEKYKETNDLRYLQSYTRIVFRTDRQTHETVGFLMSIVPDLEWLEKSNFKPFKKTSYLDREKDFGGWILFHNIDGSFSNGWIYEKGKITGVIKYLDSITVQLSLRSDYCYQTDWYYNVWDCPYWYTGSEDGYSTFCTLESSTYVGTTYDCPNSGGGGGGEYTGGSDGGGGSGPPVVAGASPEYSQITDSINKLMPQIYELLLTKGIDISKYQFRVGDECSANARFVDGYIVLCGKFLNFNIYDQASIIWHEIYHLINDSYWNPSLHALSQPIVLNPPPWVEYYIRTVLVGNDGPPAYLETIYQSYINISKIQDPQFYRNEINSYMAERNAMPDCSPSYQQEGDYQLWIFRQLLEIANTYY